MGSCVSKKAARHGGAAGSKGKVAAPLPQEKENAMSPVVVEEEVKEVVLSETPVTRRPRPPPEPVKRRQEQVEEEEEASDACSASESASVASAKEKAAKVKAGAEQAVEKMALGAPEKVRVKRTAPEESKPKGRAGNGRARSPSPGATQRKQQRDQPPEDRRRSNGGAGSGRARSPSPGAAQRRQQGGQPPSAPRPRREQPAVVSAFGCRSGRFSPSAARRAAESAVRRSHSAREADMALPAKRCLTAAIDGHANAAAAAAYGGGSGLARRDPGERSGRRSDSPTGKRPPASPSPMHRHASTTRKAAKEQRTPERARPRVRDGGGRAGDEPALLAGGEGERKDVAGQGALGQNPSVAMECFIFL
ncbi:hypothetical protein ACP70R_024946 [Stipagrostis hirtigluma subsp. patula]